jgi:hypothetical protein
MNGRVVRPGRALAVVFTIGALAAACSATTPSSAAQSSPTPAPGAPTAAASAVDPGTGSVEPAPTDWPSGLVNIPAEEGYLIAGVRTAAAVDCAPRHSDLPARAIAGIECVPDDGIAERVGVYRFATADDLLATYSERMAEAGVPLGSGGCFSGPGETNYVPGPTDLTVPYREGCFINEFGFANYRATYPDERVYVGILGSASGTAALQRWAWLGNQDQPGNPTIWRNPGP